MKQSWKVVTTLEEIPFDRAAQDLWFQPALPLEVKADRQTFLFREADRERTPVAFPTEFTTSAGRFLSDRRGEFGGTLRLPNGRELRGNFVQVFEFHKKIYAIDSLIHLGPCYAKIYTFSRSLQPRLLYETKGFGADPRIWEMLALQALQIGTDHAYLLLSGTVSRNSFCEKRQQVGKAYLFEIERRRVSVKAELDCEFDSVYNMVVEGGRMLLGMNRMVADVDLQTKQIRAYALPYTENEA